MKVCKCKPGGGTKCVYVGREWAGYEASALGNPFKSGRDGTLAEVLAKYRKWLFDRIQEGDRGVLDALGAIKGDDTLGCWCINSDRLMPRGQERCHAEVVWHAWNWMQR